VAQAQASLQALAAHLALAYPNENAGRSVILMPLDQTNVPPNQHDLFALAGTLMSVVVGLILLIACGNVANLLLTRATQRRRELAVRLSLGASRQRLIRQLLTESLLLGLVSAGLGIVLAYWSKDLVWKLLPANQRPRGLDTTLDLRVLLYTLGISIGATAIFGLIPAWQASKTSQMTALKDRSDAPSATGKWYGLRGALVMGQVALSLIALVGAGLFIHSLKNAQQMDPGFEVKHELITFVSPGALRYTPAQAEQFYHDVVERVGSLPTVAAAGISDWAPFNGTLQATLFPDTVDMADPRNGKLTPIPSAEPGFFHAAGIAMLSGREFNDHDDASAAQVGIINRALADLFWPGKDPLGRHLRFHSPLGKDKDLQVIGVVQTVKYQTLGEPPQPILYRAMKQDTDLNAVLFVQTKGDPSAAIADVRATITAVDSKMNTNANGTQLVSERMDRNLLGPRFGAELLAGFAGLALLLAAIGTYGVMAYSVSQRTQEIGIRMALGAQPTDVLRMVMGSGMAMVLGGVAAGFAISWMLTSTVSGLLYGIESFDAPIFFVTAALLIAVALFACWLPARRAMRVDPMIALRYE
jgi:predicted permease